MVLIHPKIKRFHCFAALISISFFLVSFIMTFVPIKTFHRKGLKPIDSFTIPLHIVRNVQRDYLWGLQTRGNFHRLCEPIMHLESTQCYLYLSHSMMPANNRQCLTPMVSHPTDSLNTTRLGLSSNALSAAEAGAPSGIWWYMVGGRSRQPKTLLKQIFRQVEARFFRN